MDYREKVNNYFDERENFLLQMIEQLKYTDKTRLDSLKLKCNIIEAKLDEMKCKLDAQKRNSVNLFIEATKVRKQVECLTATLNDISNENIVQRYEFIKEPAIEKLLATNNGLGTISKFQTLAASSGLGIVSKFQTLAVSSGLGIVRKQTGPIDLTSLKFTEVPGIQVKSSSDTRECRLTSMLLLTGDRLLVSDHNNSTLKLVDLQTSSMISQIKLPGATWGMCVLPWDRVAVCLYFNRSVIFLDTQEKVSVGNSIKVDGNCYDLVYHSDQLVVSFERGIIVKMDMEGNTIKRIDNVNGQAMFRSCLYMTLMDDAILVSDFHNHTITKLDIDLNILQTFKDPAMQNATGLTAVENKLIICSYGTNTILRLDLSSGTIIKLLGESDGIQHPYSAVYSPKQNKLYITSYISGQNDSNSHVHVYNAK